MSAVLRPRCLTQAIAQLAAYGSAARPLAGGTDLMVELRTGRTRATVVIDLSGLDELRVISEEQGGLRVGALVTCAHLIASDAVAAWAPLLGRACQDVGARQIQARATLGGNLGTASPASDLIPVLFALDARVRLAGAQGLRELAVTDFIQAYRATDLRAGELIESILFPREAAKRASAWRKVGTRAAQSIAKVVVAMSVGVEQGRIVHLRAAAGSVAERCILLPTLESRLLQRAPTAELLREAARAAAMEDARPIDDVRSTARYRRHSLARVLERLLNECCSSQIPAAPS